MHTLFWLVYSLHYTWNYNNLLTNKKYIYSSSFNPRKEQAGSEASTTCNLSALPSNVVSKSQTKLVDSTDCSQDVSYYIHVAI